VKKVIIAVALAVVLVASLVPSFVFANQQGLPDDATRLYKFNIIGVQNPKTADMDGSSGKVIFVNLDSPSKIYLQEALDENGDPIPYNDPDAFAVLDANGTDSDGALFQMPRPGYDAYLVPSEDPVWSDYSIFIRSLGKPYGWASITTCAQLADAEALLNMVPGLNVNKIIKNMQNPDDAYLSIEQVGQEITERPKGKSDWTNVTAELTSIVFQINIDLDESGTVDPDEIFFVRVPIFDPMLEGEYWYYDNNGLKLLQVWIYDVPTDVSLGDGDLTPLP
jgi:hypothetical protein